jgi:predicted Ser/Thr protein kinase
MRTTNVFRSCIILLMLVCIFGVIINQADARSGLKVIVHIHYIQMSQTGSAKVCLRSVAHDLGCKTIRLSDKNGDAVVRWQFGSGKIHAGDSIGACVTNLSTLVKKCSVSATNKNNNLMTFSLQIPSVDATSKAINATSSTPINAIAGSFNAIAGSFNAAAEFISHMVISDISKMGALIKHDGTYLQSIFILLAAIAISIIVGIVFLVRKLRSRNKPVLVPSIAPPVPTKPSRPPISTAKRKSPKRRGNKQVPKFWPSASDYNTAVQTNAFSFNDSNLQSARVISKPNGLPYVISGNFAFVYKFNIQNTKNLAIRCFIRPTSEHEERYKKLDEYLSKVNLPFFIRFRYLESGIRIKNGYYPIVEMDWIEGTTLDVFVKNNLGNRSLLLNLSEKFASLIQQMGKFGIAHGDLQHGNIIITKSSDIKLVDYDSMYIPSLSGDASMELGHRNYQHIRRTVDDFDENLDNFSALVIYTSLRAIALDYSLYDRFDHNDNLIFVKKDFQNPANSTIVKALGYSNDKIIRHCISTIVNGVKKGPEDFPNMEDVLNSV